MSTTQSATALDTSPANTRPDDTRDVDAGTPPATAVASAAELRRAIKVLRPLAWQNYLRLDFAPGELVLSAADGYRVLATFTLSADCETTAQPVTTTIPQLSPLVRGKGDVTLEAEGDALAVRRDGAPHTVLPTVTVPRWPDLTVPQGTGAEVDAALFAEVLPAAGADDSRPLLTTVCVDGPHLTATDSYRLHRVTLGGPLTEAPVLIPREVIQAVTTCGGTVRLVVDHDDEGGTILVETGPLRVIANGRLGQYPRVEQVIPREPPHKLTFRTATMVDALRSLARATRPMGRDSHGAYRPVRVERVAEGLRLHIIGDREEAAAEMTIPGSASSGDGFVLAANADFLADTLTDTTGELGYTDALRPVLVSEQCHGFTRTRVQMPVRVS